MSVGAGRHRDAHAERCFEADFDARRKAFLEHVCANPPREHLSGVFEEVARIAHGGALHRGVFDAALEHVARRIDCADFVLNGLLRLVYQLDAHPRVPQELLERVREVALGFKYWPDEPGVDSLCTWTENHQILFQTAALLAAQRWPDAVFRNSGESAEDKAAAARRRILRWLDLRFRSGFSEWLSNVYYDEDMTALLNLIDFCSDPEIRTRAAIVLDTMLLDLALNSFRGVFGCTHGRSYERNKKWAQQESTTDVSKLLFGTGSFAGVESMAASCFALSRYRLPRALFEIANDTRPLLNRQRHGIRIDELERWGIGLSDFEDGMLLLSMEAYTHPRSFALFVRMLDAWGWWDNEFFAPFKREQKLIRELAARGELARLASSFEWDLTRNLRSEVHTESFRTADFMLSTAQDWRAGNGGDQQHVWQATLGPDAVCFTTHPGPRSARSPGHWTGSALLPRAAQVRNVALVLYRIEQRPAVFVESRNHFTHAWLPRDRFDELAERDGWSFARRGDGYLALRPSQPPRWQDEPGEDRGRELIAEGDEHAWICELGSRATSGDFPSFVRSLAAAPVEVRDGPTLSYRSPTQGELSFGWQGPLRRNGVEVPLGDHPRYDNPYVRAEFPCEALDLSSATARLRLDWREPGRDPGPLV